jgi:hypothetical protein
MHIRIAHETCVRVQVVFNAIPAAEEFLEEIKQRDDVFLANSSAAMVFFYTLNERLARSLALDFERRWLERLIASSTPSARLMPASAPSEAPSEAPSGVIEEASDQFAKTSARVRPAKNAPKK